MFVKLTWDIKFKIIALLFIFCIITAHIVNASAEVEKMQNFYKFVSENKLLPAEASKICKNKLDEDKLMKIVLFGAIGLFAAPLIAPMFAAAGLFGAAAVSSGLATLGGGALSAGGFGMIGGTIVVGTVSSGLGLLLSNDNCGINAIVYDKYIICSTENSCSLIFEGRISIGDSIRLMDGKFYDGNNIYKIKYNDGKVVEYNSENLPLSE